MVEHNKGENDWAKTVIRQNPGNADFPLGLELAKIEANTRAELFQKTSKNNNQSSKQFKNLMKIYKQSAIKASSQRHMTVNQSAILRECIRIGLCQMEEEWEKNEQGT